MNINITTFSRYFRISSFKIHLNNKYIVYPIILILITKNLLMISWMDNTKFFLSLRI